MHIRTNHRGIPRTPGTRQAAAAVVPVTPLARTLLAAAAAALLALVALFGAPAASAHDSLISTTPKQGATVTEPLETVVLSFSGELKSIGTNVSLVDAQGQKHEAAATVSRNELTVAFPAALPNGDYTLTWRTVSSDGHPIEGTTANKDALAFSVQDPAAGTATQSAASTPGASQDDGAATPADEADAKAATGLLGDIPPALAWIVLALAILAATGVVLAKVRRQTK